MKALSGERIAEIRCDLNDTSRPQRPLPILPVELSILLDMADQCEQIKEDLKHARLQAELWNTRSAANQIDALALQAGLKRAIEALDDYAERCAFLPPEVEPTQDKLAAELRKEFFAEEEGG